MSKSTGNIFLKATIAVGIVTALSSVALSQNVQSTATDLFNNLVELQKLRFEMSYMSRPDAQDEVTATQPQSTKQTRYSKAASQAKIYEDIINQNKIHLLQGGSSDGIMSFPIGNATRDVRETLLLFDSQLQNGSTFMMDMNNARNYKVYLAAERDDLNEGQEKSANDYRPDTWISVKCSHPFVIHNHIIDQKIKAEKWETLRLRDTNRHARTIGLELPLDIESCQVRFDKDGSIVNLKPIRNARRGEFEACFVPTGGTGLQQGFFNTDLFAMSCPSEVNEIELMPDAEKAFATRIEALLGTKLPEDYIANRNPLAKLDYSHAPSFEYIYVSALVFRADFYGVTLARLLKHHADRGTQVRIIVSDVTQLPKDREQSDILTTKSPNIKVQEYKFRNYKVKSLMDFFSPAHRTNHTKLFVAKVRDESSEHKSIAILGGRNVHEGFLYANAPRRKPIKKFIVDYRVDEKFVFWRDFEIAIRDKTFIEQATRQFESLWERDSKKFIQRPVSIAIPMNSAESEPRLMMAQDKTLVRHMISSPFTDDKALEAYYVKLFDAAESEIVMTTPYFNMTKAITASIERAIARGVSVKLITSLDHYADFAGGFVSNVNRNSVNKAIEKQVRIYAYKKPGSVLHAKIIVIDKKLTVLGSVNLNNRSFIHDSENIFVTLSTKFARDLEPVIQDYMSTSTEIDGPVKVSAWRKLLTSPVNQVF